MYENSKGAVHKATKHKSFFDELWEKDHPNEARNLEKQEAEARKQPTVSQKQSEEGKEPNDLTV